MKYDVRKKCDKQSSWCERLTIPVLGILLIVALMFAIRYFHQEPAHNETIEEELPIPEEIKEKEAPELTKLNPDSEVKEGW